MAVLNRREFIRLAGVGAAAAAATLPGGANPVAQADVTPKPNILFLFTDDQRFDTLSAWGNGEIATPNMDRLVRSGVSFTHACIMGSTVPAVCCPSRAMLNSGRTLYRAPRDLADTLTLPEVLRAAGYQTFATGKWHNGRASLARGFSTGAKIFFGGMSDHLKVPVYDFDGGGEYPKSRQYVGSKFSSELFSDEAVRFLHEYDDNSPFYMYVSYTAPHDPRMAPEKFASMYKPGALRVPSNFMPEHPFDNGELKIRDEKLAPFPRTPEIVQEHIAAYYAMITHLDDQIGRVLAKLEETGHADNTIIILAGDNGLAVGQHGLMGKQNMYEHSIRVPLILSGPGLPHNETRSGMCYLHDIFPTVCDLAGMPTPATVEGSSLTPMIAGQAARIRDSQFHAYMGVQRCVREERYKLIEYYVQGKRTTQLFDLASDPWETNNLADSAAYADHIDRLSGELSSWQRRVGDPMLS